MKGRNFLKVTGILMIIGGALTIIVSGIIGLIGALGASAIASAVGTDADAAVVGSAVGGVLIFAAIVSLVGGILELIAGIVGVKNNNKPEKATACIVWGFIVLVINIISLILSLSGGNSNAGSVIVSIVCSIALPVLYLIGGFLNKKSA